MITIEQLREDTYNEVIKMLNEKGKCALIRPTGFGKTGILTRLCSHYSKVLFLYPADIVEEALRRFYYGDNDYYKYSEIPGVTIESFRSIQGKSKDEIKYMMSGIELIIVDECHRLGGTETYKAFKEIIELFPNVPRIGATATPERMDLVDVVGDFFDNCTVSTITMHDMIGIYKIFKKPYYCYCSYGEADTNEVINEYRKNYDKLSTEEINTAEEILKSRLIEISNLQNMPNIVKDCCEYAFDKEYIKFIVFFSGFKHMADKGDTVEEWFREAFPNYTLDKLIISSENEDYANNVYKLNKLRKQINHIDLVYCIDKINMGFHVGDLTGIVMYRGTASGIVYQQQLGRVINSVYSGIVIDIVDNIHRKALYENLGKLGSATVKKKKRLTSLIKKKEKLERQGKTLSEAEQKELYKLASEVKSFLESREKPAYNRLLEEDLIAIGNEATYRELIAKTVAEPISMRCRQAWARWKEYGGNEQPFFREYIEARGLMGTDREGKDMPLWPFCEEKNVTVNMVLNTMGVPRLSKGQTVHFED